MLNPTAGDIVSETNTKKPTLIDPAVPFSVCPGKLAQGHTHKKKKNYDYSLVLILSLSCHYDTDTFSVQLLNVASVSCCR